MFTNSQNQGPMGLRYIEGWTKICHKGLPLSEEDLAFLRSKPEKVQKLLSLRQSALSWNIRTKGVGD